jgi:hypothetical protein
VALIRHFLAKPVKNAVIRDKMDFLLVQYFSQLAPSGVGDAEVDLAYVAHALEPVIGEAELKPPVWLNALDRVLESSRRCRALDELLHSGILDQGRKAKDLAGDLFYLPIALAAFTRFGYLMRRSFFRLMLGDLNAILDGLNELEEKNVATIDCRRAQFSAQEPIIRLRMICQSWKVMFQAEYSSGQPLRMLVDLRACVDFALGRGKAPEADAKANAAEKTPAGKSLAGKNPAGKASGAQGAVAKTTAANEDKATLPKPKAAPSPQPSTSGKPAAAPGKAWAAAAAGTGFKSMGKQPTTAVPAGNRTAPPAAAPELAAPELAAPEFEVSNAPDWDSEGSAHPPKKK